MPPVKVMENIFWVGAVDWNIKHFHGFSYSTQRGTSYNAYLIVDKKVALVDTVQHTFADEMIERRIMPTPKTNIKPVTRFELIDI